MKTAAQAVLVFRLITTALPVLAHHSFNAVYDESHQITLSGTVTKVTWKHPPVLIQVNVKDDGGQIANWDFELASPNGLLGQGWKVDSIKPGDQVTVSGYRARDAAKNLLNARKITRGAPGSSTASR